VVEDVALARQVKQGGEQLVNATLRATWKSGMYRDAAAVYEAFGKNLNALAGGRPLPFAGLSPGRKKLAGIGDT